MTEPIDTMDKANEAAAEAIAIIGMAGRFPGASDLRQFWRNLRDGVESIRAFTPEELAAAGVDAATLADPDFVNRGAYPDQPDGFDAAFFGVQPREAQIMDPQHRLMLECAWASLEDAGYDPEAFTGRIGVFGGVAPNTYLEKNLSTRPELLAEVGDYARMIASEKEYAVTRLAFKLNLRGPAVSVNTACSSSGVALHFACQSLLSGESDMALVGGGRVRVPLHAGYVYQEDGIPSPDGHCRAFDADARGTVIGNGVAMVTLKRLVDAQRDGDHVRAVILATAINNDGSAKVGFTAPSVRGQAEVIEEAIDLAGIDADSIGYVEAHGTGTAVGDPIEITALSRAFAKTTDRRQFCAIGSVKTNIGHLDAGAGVTGLIKAVLSLENEAIPPSLHYQRPNPRIDFDSSPFFVNARLRPWPRSEQPRRASVSSFGLGGTNAHIVLEEAPSPVATGPSRSHQLVVLSARSETALDAATARLARELEEEPESNLADVAHTLQVGRRRFQHRRAVVAESVESARQALQHVDPARVMTDHSGRTEVPVAFMFPGGGAQYPQMGHDLYRAEPAFRAAVDRCRDFLRAEIGVDIREVLFADKVEHDLERPSLALPVLFTVEYALAELWMDWGLRPRAFIGHSMGEYVAACLAGVISLEDGLRLVSVRGRLFEELPEGAMLSVPMGEAEVLALTADELDIAAANRPDQCVLSGSVASIDRAGQALAERGVDSTRIHIAVAAHSRLVEPILEEFREFVGLIELRPPSIPYVSNVTGDWIRPEEATDPEYWVRHLRQTVRFSEGLERLFGEVDGILLEIGPGRVLSTFAQQHPARPKQTVVAPSLRHPKEVTSDVAFVLKTLGRLWLSGAEIDWKRFHRNERRRRVPLPAYPFERQRFWIDANAGVVPQKPAALAPVPAVSASAPAAPPRKQRLDAGIRDIINGLTGVAPADIDPHVSFLELGLDSLALTQVANAAQKRFGVKLVLRQLFDEAPSVDALAAFLDAQLPKEAAIAAAVTVAPAATPVARKPRLVDGVKDIINGLTGVAPSDIDTHVSFLELGLDSLALTQVANAVQKRFGVKLVLRQLFDEAPSVDALATWLDAQLPAEALPAPVAAAAPVVSAAPVTAGSLEDILARQLQLMEQQTRILQSLAGGAGAVAVPTPKPVALRTPAAPATGGNIGPWKPLEKGARKDLTAQQQQALDELIARFTARTARSKAITQSTRHNLADPRSVAGFRREWKEIVYPIYAETSKGARIHDVDGNEWLDITMGFGVTLFGHAPDFINDAVRKQLDLHYAIGPQTELTGRVAALVSELTGLERVAFCNTGSEAVLAAIRTCRTVTGKDKIAVFSGDYHGIFDEVLVKRVGQTNKAVPVAPGIPHNALDSILVLDYGEARALDEIRANIDDLAAVIVEPVQSRNPTLQPREFLQQLRALTRELDVPLVFDEMITGFRVHPGGAQAYFGVKADIAAYGKVVAGGMPIGVIAGDHRYLDALDGGAWQFGDDSAPEAGMTWFSGTFVRHPLALAAAEAALLELKAQGPQLQARINANCDRLVGELNRWYEEYQFPIRIEHFSSLFLPRFSHEFAGLFWHHLRDAGIHTHEGRPNYLTAAHTDADLARIERAFKAAALWLRASGFLGDGGPLPELPPDDGAPQRRPQPTAAPATRPAGEPVTEEVREIWVASQLGHDVSCSYNLSYSLAFRGAFDAEALRRALARVVERHEALRMTVSADGERLVFAERLDVQLPLVECDGTERATALQQRVDEDLETAFDLRHGPLLRGRILRFAAADHVVLLCVHHLAADGFSMGTVMRELGALYAAECSGKPADLPPSTPYREYAAWQQQERRSPRFTEAERFWVALCSEPLPPPLELPTDRPRPPQKTFGSAMLRGRFDKDLIAAVRKVGAKHGCTAFSTMLAAFTTVVHRLTDQDDVVVGVPAAGQTMFGKDRLVGHCAHHHPLRSRIDQEQTFVQHLAATRKLVLDAQDHANYTEGTLHRRLKLSRDPSRLPLVNLQFNLDAAPLRAGFGDADVSISYNGRHYSTPDLNVNLVEVDGGIDVRCEYNTDLFDASTIERWLRHYEVALRDIVAEPQRRLADVALLSDEDRQLIVETWNQTASTGVPVCLHDAFRAQVERTPDATALIVGNSELSYRELDRRSEQIADLLRARNLAAETLVGVSLHRTELLVAALLGVLKANAAYVPLDPAYPQERVRMILADSKAPIVLTQSEQRDRLPADSSEFICLDQLQDEPAAAGRPAVAGDPAQLAYVIYTSGSTGRPKGVAIEHRSVSALLAWARTVYSQQQLAGVLASTSVCFDLSVYELFLPLTSGGTVVLADNALALPRLPAKDRVTLINSVPSAMTELVRLGLPASVKTVNLAGEPLKRTLVDRIYDCGVERVYDLYGPSEDTTYSTWVLRERGGRETIGRPLDGTRAYVLDRRGQPTPIGVPGELCLAGDGLARGYMHRPDLTAERFVRDPLSSDPQARMYRTGDIARFLPDGYLELSGRLDHQVKLRGFRIELGEIEHCLLDTPRVKDAVAVVREVGGEQALVGYVVGEVDGELQARSLRDALRRRLPDYMVPQHFVLLPDLPRTPNGKVDRKALPLPGGVATEAAAPTASPASTAVSLWRPSWVPTAETERQVAGRTWLLFVDRVGVGARLAERLRAQGGNVLTVHSGDSFGSRGADGFVLNPEGGIDEYRRLAAALASAGRVPHEVVHLWLVTAEDECRRGSSFFHHLQDHGWQSATALAEALHAEFGDTEMRWTVVGSGVAQLEPAEVIEHPEKAMVEAAAVRARPGWTWRTIDLPQDLFTDARLRRRPLGAATLDSIVARLIADASGTLLAYRDGRLRQRTFEPAVFDAATPAVRLQSRGTYLVTGGLGGLGFRVAQTLARAAQARLVIIDRAHLPERSDWSAWLAALGEADATSRRIERVRSLEAAGAEVHVETCDIADLETCRRALAVAKVRFGLPAGVVHAAGVGVDDPRTEPAQAGERFAALVYGELVLDDILEDHRPDFRITCTSADDFFGTTGSVEGQAAAAFVEAHARLRCGRTSLALFAADAATGAELPGFTAVLGGGFTRSVVAARGRIEACIASSRAATPVATASGDGAPRDEIERSLVELWRELLATPRVRIDDDFFDLGGHSLIAVRMLSRLQESHGVDWPLSVLLQAPTIERVAELLRAARGTTTNGVAAQPKPASQYRYALPLAESRDPSATPLFIVSGAFGNVLNLRHLGKLVGQDRPCYGLQARGLLGETAPHTSIEEMAADFLQEVRAIQPHGPYLLGGFCSGGLAAYEMAVQLAARGERTDLVVLLDSRVPNRVDALTTMDRVRIKAQQFRRRGVRFPFEWARSRARWELGRLRRALGMGPTATGADGSFQSQRIFHATEQAMDRYVPPPYAGRVAFFRPPLQHHYRLGANRAVDKELVFVRPDGGWSPYVKDLDVFEVPGEPGDHDGFVLEPAVRTLVAKLRQCWRPSS